MTSNNGTGKKNLLSIFQGTEYADLMDKIKNHPKSHLTTIKIYSAHNYTSAVEVLRAELFNLEYTNSRPDKDSSENMKRKASLMSNIRKICLSQYEPRHKSKAYNNMLSYTSFSVIQSQLSYLNTKEFTNSDSCLYDRSSDNRVWALETEQGKSKVCYTTCTHFRISMDHTIIVYADNFFESVDIFLDFIGTL